MAAVPLEHADQARLALRTIVSEHGPEMLSRPGTLSNLLADLLPDAPRIARILVAAAQDHIADELREHTSAGMDPVTASRIAATVFADATMFPPDACAWVVGEFALALGLVSDNSAPPIKFSPSVTAVMAADPARPGPVAGPDKSTEPAATEPDAPVRGRGAAGPAGVGVGPGRRGGKAPGRGRQHGSGADPGGRIKAPFPAAGLSPDPGAAAAGAVGASAAGSVGDPGAGGSVGGDPVETAAAVGVDGGAGVAGGAAETEVDGAQVAGAGVAGAADGAVAAQAEGAQARAAEIDAGDAARSPVAADPARTAAIWTVVVSADRAYFDSVIADGHVDAASIKYPSSYPERRFELNGDEMRIGRRSVSRRLEPEIDLAGPPTDPGISHLHAVLIAQEDGTWSVLDRGSSNGTLVNGREIESGQPIPLRDGDRVCLGAWTALTFHSDLAP